MLLIAGGKEADERRAHRRPFGCFRLGSCQRARARSPRGPRASMWPLPGSRRKSRRLNHLTQIASLLRCRQESVFVNKKPVIVERVVCDIDEIARFPGWQHASAGEREVKKALRKTLQVQAARRGGAVREGVRHIKQY